MALTSIPFGNEDQELQTHLRLKLEGSALFERYLCGVKRYRVVVIGFWVLCLFVSLFLAPAFLGIRNDSMDPPSGSLAYRAQQEFEVRFGDRATTLPVLVLIECLERKNASQVCDVRSPELASFYRELEAWTLEYNSTHNNVLDVLSYYKYDELGLEDVKNGFVNTSNYKDSFVTILVRSSDETTIRSDFVKALDSQLSVLAGDPALAQYAIGATGFDAMNSANVEDSQRQIMVIDSVTVPIAVVILVGMIRSPRLLLLAALNLVVAMLVSFAVMTVAIKGLGAPSPEGTTPQLMEVIIIALTIDYSLFTLRRLRDEIKKGASPSFAIYVMMHRAGHVVLMSGTTLMFVLLAFLLIPNTTIRMDGIACAVGVVVAMLVNITLTPAMLYAFPAFFTSTSPAGNRGSCFFHGQKPVVEPSAEQSEEEESENDYVAFADAPAQGLGVHHKYKTYRFMLTKVVTTFPYNIAAILLLYVLAIPLAVQIFRIELDQNILHLLPRGADTTERLRRMYVEFPGGTFAPFDVVVNLPATSNNSVLDADVFALARNIGDRIVAETECHADSVGSPASFGGHSISPLEAEGLLLAAQVCGESGGAKTLCKLPREYELLWKNSVNSQGNSMLINVVVPFLPFDKKSDGFIKAVNGILDTEAAAFNAAEHAHNVELWLTGFEVGPNSIEEAVFKVFPWMITATMVSIFLVLGVMLQSYFCPIRLALTLFLPITSVFGLAVLVYQDGVLNWTGISSLSSSDGFFWSVPIMIVSIVAGLVIDWDLLLISRIQEHRSFGYDVQAATCKAVAEVGPTVSAAGLIMICCFAGLLLSDQTLINQAGFLLSTSVIVDTCLVNTILVPAIVSLGDKVAWTPRVMPMHNLITLDSPEFSEATLL